MKVIVFSLMIFFPLIASSGKTSPVELLKQNDILDIEYLEQKLMRLKAKINPVSYTHLTLPTILRV